MTAQLGHETSGAYVPYSTSLVIACGGQQRAIRAERHVQDCRRVAAQQRELVAAGRVPQPGRPIIAGRRYAGAVRTKPSNVNLQHVASEDDRWVVAPQPTP